MLFVGEKRSKKAKQMGVAWKDGRLAAKQLFDALKSININPQEQQYCNWFEGGKAITRNYRGEVIAMGRKVSSALTKEGIPHKFIIHPAAKGAIRKKENYLAHVKSQLLCEQIALNSKN